MSVCTLHGLRRLLQRRSLQKCVLNHFHRSSRLNQKDSSRNKKIRSTLYYVSAAGVLTVGLSYAAVPLYRMFCQAYSYGGTTSVGHDTSKIEAMKSLKHRPIRVLFNADTASSMRWNFKPQQNEITVRFIEIVFYLLTVSFKVVPGETALAFYTARNPTATPVIGISTYNVVPFEAGQYFNKIQCFCFEEQQLNPNEEVSKQHQINTDL